jgi:hypothetical protein
MGPPCNGVDWYKRGTVGSRGLRPVAPSLTPSLSAFRNELLNYKSARHRGDLIISYEQDHTHQTALTPQHAITDGGKREGSCLGGRGWKRTR